jgi:hypothetical protein
MVPLCAGHSDTEGRDYCVATYAFLIKGGTIVEGTVVACKTVRLTRPSIPCVGEAAIGSMIPGFSSVLIESLLSGS